MNSDCKVTIETPEEKYEFSCDFVASVFITKVPVGHDCKVLACGDLDQSGILSALDSLKRLEEALLSKIPMPRDIVEHFLQKKAESRTANISKDSEKNQDLIGEMLKSVLETAQRNNGLLPDESTNL